MTPLQDVIAILDELGVEIVYRPLGGAERTIRAIVRRRGVEARIEAGGVWKRITEIHVANDATIGIADADVDFGGDEVEVAPRAGGPARRLQLIGYAEGSETDEGMIALSAV